MRPSREHIAYFSCATMAAWTLSVYGAKQHSAVFQLDGVGFSLLTEVRDAPLAPSADDNPRSIGIASGGIPGILWTYNRLVPPSPIPETVAFSTAVNQVWVAQDLNFQSLQRFQINGAGIPETDLTGWPGDSQVVVAAAKEADLAVWLVETNTVTIHAFNTIMDEPLWDFTFPVPFTNIGNRSVKVSRDGSTVCCEVRDDGPPEATRVYFFDAADGDIINTWNYPDRVEGVDITDDGSLCLIKEGANGRVINTTSGMEVGMGSTIGVGGGWGTSGDGNVFAIGGFTQFRVFKKMAAVYSPVITHNNANLAFIAVAVSRDGSTVATMAVNPFNFLNTSTLVFDVATAALIDHYDTTGTGIRQDFPTSAAIADDGSVIAVSSTGTQDNSHPEVLILDRCVNLIGSIDTAGSPTQVDVTGDGQYVVAGSKSVHATVLGNGGTVTMYQVFEPGEPRIIYVNDDAAPNGDGTSWATAFQDLQDALDVACGNSHIWVASGVYRPSKPATADRSATFALMNGVEIYGGFEGDEGDFGQRMDPLIHLGHTILSGDINAPGILTDNCYSTVTAAGVDESAILDGFTIQHGYADGTSLPLGTAGGGALFINGGQPTLRNLYFFMNAGRQGGAILHRSASDSQIRNAIFIENITLYGAGGAGGVGGAIQNSVGSHITIHDSLFVENRAPDGACGAVYGTGTGSHVEFHRCRFEANSAFRGGAVCVDGNAVITAEDSTFLANHTTGTNPSPVAASFGGVAAVLSADAFFKDCDLLHNMSQEFGGALFAAGNGDVSLVNTTLAFNDAVELGGGFYGVQGGNLTAVSSIFWDNTDANGANHDASAQIFNDTSFNPPNVINVTYSCVQDDDPLDMVVYRGTGNIDDDPLFVEGLAGALAGGGEDLRLLPESPAIDAGDPSVMFEQGERDFDGLARVLCGRVDMGAHEWGLGDGDCDRDVDLRDWQGLQNCFGIAAEAITGECVSFDGDGQSAIDLDDAAKVYESFSGPTAP